MKPEPERHELAHFPITVPFDLYEEVADTIRESFADSYLCGAYVRHDRLLPRTQTAWSRLKANAEFMAIIDRRGIQLMKPPPFEPKREDVQQQRRKRIQAG